MEFDFYKMSGHGNDFILVDNWEGQIPAAEMASLAKAACRRRLSVGADGMVFLEPGPDEVDFSWRFFNSDGSEAEMCGNAGRCTAWFANQTGIAPSQMCFLTVAGVIQAEVLPDTVKIQMTPPTDMQLDCPLDIDGVSLNFCSINTGVPHAVTWVEDIEEPDVAAMGRAVRFHPTFQPAGTNANFVQVLEPGRLAVRTYERGVEDETLACGTGCIASVLLSAQKGFTTSPTRVLTRSGEELIVHFSETPEGFGPVFLEGRVRLIYTGRLGPDALR